MRKFLIGLLAGAVAVSVMAGCGNKGGAGGGEQQISADTSKAKGKLEVWTNLGQEEMNFYVKEFNKYVPDVKVNVTVMPSKEYRTKLQNAFRTGKNAPDVATFEISDFGVYKDTDYVENLSQPQYNAGELLKDMIPYVQELSKDADGNIKGLSWQSTPGGFWYKKALAREYLGTDEPEELYELLSSWDKIIELGRQVHEKSGGKVGLLDDVESILQIYASYKGQPWVDKDGKLVSRQYMEDMYTLMKQVLDNKGSAQAESWSAGWTSGMFSNDMFILVGMPSWGLNFCIKPGIPADKMQEAADTWGYMKAPVPYQNGGTWYAMYAKSQNKDAAWAWIKTMTANQDYLVNGLSGQLGDFPSYVPAIEQLIKDGHTDIVTGEQQYFEDFYETAKSVKADPMTKYDRQAWISATDQMKQLASGAVTPAQAAEGFENDMKNIYPELKTD